VPDSNVITGTDYLIADFNVPGADASELNNRRSPSKNFFDPVVQHFLVFKAVN
jgi:hypothetical protein